MKWLLPPWLAVPLRFIKGLISAVPWKVWGALAVVAVVFFVKHVSFNAGVAVTNAAWQAKYDKAKAEYESEARERERKHVEETDRIAENLIRERNRGFEERDKTIADLRAGALRLRPRFQCPTRQPAGATGAAAAGSDGGAQAGLSGTDAEFFIREASRADEITRQLTACQAVIRADREFINGNK